MYNRDPFDKFPATFHSIATIYIISLNCTEAFMCESFVITFLLNYDKSTTQARCSLGPGNFDQEEGRNCSILKNVPR